MQVIRVDKLPYSVLELIVSKEAVLDYVMDSLDMAQLDFYSEQVNNSSLQCQKCIAEESEMWWDSFTTMLVMKEVIVMTVACALGLISNILAIYLVAASKKGLHLTASYIINRAVADILFLLTVPYDVRAHMQDSWVFGSLLCKLRSSLVIIGPIVSSVSLMGLSGSWYIDTCMSGVSAKFRSNLLKITSAMSWITLFLFSIPTFLQSEIFKEVLQERFHCVSLPLSEDSPLSQVLRFLIILLTFVVPFVMCWVFISLIIPAYKSQTCKPQEQNISEMNKGESLYPYRLLVSLLVVFTACQVPYWLVYLVQEFLQGIELSHVALLAFPATLCLPSINAAINPLMCIYYLKDLKKSQCRAKETEEEPQMIALVHL
nr:C-C chemokine receptor type 6-like [Cherax quadricarinatus]